ncbi:MAG: hypothetical protein ACOVP5_05470 [Chitinophagales bacterium]
MILRCFLLLVFLFQVGFTPLLASDKYAYSKTTSKSESKQKPSKSEMFEEDEDESEKHFGPFGLTFIKKVRFCFIEREIVQSAFSDHSFFSLSKLPIYIWVQNFRI